MTLDIGRLSPRFIDGCGAALILGVVVLAYALGVHPVLDRQLAAERERGTLHAEAIRADQAELALAAEQGRLARAEALRAEAVQLVPAQGINTRIAMLTGLAAAHDLAMKQVEPKAPARDPAGRFVAVPITLGGVGTFAQCRAFLAMLHAEQLDVSVAGVRLNIAEPASENEAARLSFGFDLVWYAAVDDPAAGR